MSFVLLAALVALSGCATAHAQTSSDPASVRIVTSDIATFWNAYDEGVRDGDLAKAFDDDYIAKGSPGVHGFVPHRIVSGTHLASVVGRNRDYYLAARSQMGAIAAEQPQIERDLYRYKKLYPPAVFPDVYVVVGALNSAGTSVDGVGLVMGAEMFSRPAVLPAMPSFGNPDVLLTPKALPGLVVHELTHYNQHIADQQTLLASTIAEGTADFVAEMVEPSHASPAQWSFGCAHEDALWKTFADQMSSTDRGVIKPWLFSYDPGPLGAPPFIGYWLGSRIVQTYYLTHGSSQPALDAIMHIQDFNQFLASSGYPKQRPNCAPATLPS